MNPLFDFTAKEIGLLQMSVCAIAQTTAHAISEGVMPPDGLLEAIESVMNKLDKVVEARIENDNLFEAIVQPLTDVQQSFGVLVKNPDVEIDEYN